MTDQELPESRFNLWRAIVAMVHVDGVVKPHEINFIAEQTRDLPLSAAQRDVLKADLAEPQDIKVFFDKITRPQDRDDFFRLARTIAWSDGHYDQREEEILARIGLSLENEGREISAGELDDSVMIDEASAPKGLALLNLVRAMVGRAN